MGIGRLVWSRLIISLMPTFGSLLIPTPIVGTRERRLQEVTPRLGVGVGEPPKVTTRLGTTCRSLLKVITRLVAGARFLFG